MKTMVISRMKTKKNKFLLYINYFVYVSTHIILLFFQNLW